MISLDFKIVNPFKSDYRDTKTWFNKTWNLTKNKSLEIDIYTAQCYNLFQFALSTVWRGHDHAGPGFVLEIFEFCFDIYVRDKRHWDWDNGTWEKERN